MKRTTNITWGIILVVLGLIWGLNTLGIAEINLFFDGWWTLVWIIPCIFGLFKDKDKTGDIIGIVIGIAILLGCQGIINFKLIWKLFLPSVAIIIGISLIFKDTFNQKTKNAIKKLNGSSENSQESINAIFSSQDINYENRLFKGVELNAIFGAIKLDLKKAIINDDVVINLSSIFGGIDIYVPEDINVKVSSTSIFGGISDKRIQKCKDSSITIYINATCLFGGVDVK